MKSIHDVRAQIGLMVGTMGLIGSPAMAQPRPVETIDQTEVVRHLNAETISPALAVVTGNQLNSMDPQGNAIITATATNGLKFDINFSACDAIEAGEDKASAGQAIDSDTEPTCKALYLISRWDAMAPEKRSEFANTVAAFRLDHPSMNAGLFDDGTPFAIRYVIADYGTMQGNLVSEFANFIRGATEFQNTIAPLYFE